MTQLKSTFESALWSQLFYLRFFLHFFKHILVQAQGSVAFLLYMFSGTALVRVKEEREEEKKSYNSKMYFYRITISPKKVTNLGRKY